MEDNLSNEAFSLLKRQPIRYDPKSYLSKYPNAVKRHTNVADQQAFDVLYQAMQEIGDICEKAIRGGKDRHRNALHRIMKICKGVQ